MQVKGLATEPQALPVRAHGKPKNQKSAATQTKPEATVKGETTSQPRGVIRLLQEGHFKGVADVRLRINFHEELSALQQAASTEQVQTAAPDMVGAVRAALDESLAGLSPTEEQTTAINDAFQAFATGIQTLADAGQSDTFAADAGSVFETLLADLTPILTALEPPVAVTTETPEETPDPGAAGVSDPAEDGIPGAVPADLGTEPEPEPATVEPTLTGYEGVLERLREAFSGGIEALTQAVDSASILPALSEPEGNGRAYDKFVAMYNELYGINVPETPSEGNEPIVSPLDATV